MKQRRLLLTNDDGIEAPGLAALEDACRSLPGYEILVVAPLHPHSLCGHRVTTHAPLYVERRGEGRFAIDGTPADCVRMALFALNLAPDFVISGINEGGNMGQDLFISGTVAAAREAAYHGISSLAISHYLVRDHELSWPRASLWAGVVLEEWLAAPTVPGIYRNVNLPHPSQWSDVDPIPSRVMTKPARPPLCVSFRPLEHTDGREGWIYTGRYSERPAPVDSDVAVCFGGGISISDCELDDI